MRIAREGEIVDQAMGVSVGGLLETLEGRGIPLPHEIGTFVALQACERMIDAPMSLDGDVVWIHDDGAVRVAAADAATDEVAARSVVKMLGDLLIRSAPGVPPVVLELVENGPSDGSWGLARLRDDLEAALVPLNRGATSRVLGRLIRETQRESARGEHAGLAAREEARLSSELDALLGTNVAGTEAEWSSGEEASSADLDAMMYSPAPRAGETARPTLRLRDDIEQLRESPTTGGWAIWIAAASLCATAALLWFVTR